VTLYYLKNRKEISFARAAFWAGRVYSTRYERVMTDADIRAVKTHGSRLADSGSVATAEPSPCTGSAVARAECAAGRAENAAEAHRPGSGPGREPRTGPRQSSKR
jgi:hypothetical protein